MLPLKCKDFTPNNNQTCLTRFACKQCDKNQEEINDICADVQEGAKFTDYKENKIHNLSKGIAIICTPPLIPEKCDICQTEIPPEELAFAKDPAAHPGLFGCICQKCYSKQCQEDPAAPWTDPISGEVDYDEMAEDLGCPEMGDNYDGSGEDFY